MMEGYALLVGVDQLNHYHYGSNKDLCSSKNDTRAIYNLLFETGLFTEQNMFLRNNSDTRWSYLLDDLNYIKRKANEAKDGAFIFIYFTGHGASIENPIGETEKKKQFICLYDQLVLEDVIQEKLCEFNENCRVFVLFDSCYSQGIIAKTLKTKKNEFAPPIKSLSEEFKYIFRLHYNVYKKYIQFYQDFNFNPKAQLFFIFACGKDQQTNGGNSCSDLSEFTELFCSTWRELKSSGQETNYFSLALKLSEKTLEKSTFLSIPEKEAEFFKTTFPLIFKS